MRTVIDRSQLADGSNREVQIVLHSDPRYKGSVEQIKTHPLFLQLAEVQRAFVCAYLVDRDVRRAAYAAGTYSNDHSGQMAGMRMLRDFRIRCLVEEFDGEAPPASDAPMTDQELTYLITKRLRSGQISDGTFSDLTAKLIELKGWRKSKRKVPAQPKTESAQPTPEVESELSDPFEKVRQLEAQRSANNA